MTEEFGYQHTTRVVRKPSILKRNIGYEHEEVSTARTKLRQMVLDSDDDEEEQSADELSQKNKKKRCKEKTREERQTN